LLPETVIIPSPNPITAFGIEAILIVIIIGCEVAGFYYLRSGH
jgi:hypothetical protein